MGVLKSVKVRELIAGLLGLVYICFSLLLGHLYAPGGRISLENDQFLFILFVVLILLCSVCSIYTAVAFKVGDD